MILVGSPLWALLMQSDTITWCILITLLIMSLLTWTIALQKLFMYRAAIQCAQETVTYLARDSSYAEMRARLNKQSTDLFSLAVPIDRALAERALDNRSHWSYDDIQLLRDGLYNAVEVINSTTAHYTGVLRATSEAAPLLGLLGTIWGLIHSFVRIAAEKTADIATVAPGIAEALITTLMGLLVAIPALLFFHTVQRHAERYEENLLLIADILAHAAQSTIR